MRGTDELKTIPHWVGWHNEKRQGKETKVPKNPHTGGNASSTDPATWADADTAWKARRKYGWTGIGWVFTIPTGIVGLDLDDCFTDPENGILKPWARDVVYMCNSYTERSPSGKGLHIFVRGAIPASINRSTRGFEMYNEARYFTVTGQQFGRAAAELGLASEAIEERQKELDALYVVFADERPVEPPAPKPYHPASVDAAEIKRALACVPTRLDYFDWLRVLMAVHDVLPGAEGIALIESWSPGFEGEVAAKFKSFDRTAKDGVTIGTLFHLAKQNGYQRQVNRTGRRTMSTVDRLNTLATAGHERRTIDINMAP